MEIRVFSRSGKDLGSFQLSEKAKLSDLKQKFHEKHKQFSPDRQRFCLKNASGPALNDESLALSALLKEERVLCFKDLGLQLSWRLVYMIEYAGPLVIVPLLYYFPEKIYGFSTPKTLTQNTGFLMMIGHFLKRELESMFLHRFSSQTMPAKNLIVNCTYYWLLNGLFIGYFLMHPGYTEPDWNPIVRNCLVGGFCLAQVMNFLCHLTLRNLRPPGTKVRGIPKGWGFGFVSCANYFWETTAWATFAGLIKSVPGYVFLIATLFILSKWSKDRHRKYLKEFDGKEGRSLYPKGRTAYIPFLV